MATDSQSFRDFGLEAQAAAEAHLEACYDHLGHDEEHSPAVAPFCGCTTCVVREVLWASWEIMDGYIDDALKKPPDPTCAD